MTPGTYGNESGSYYVNAAGSVYLIQSADMRPGETSQRIDALPPDAKRINANDLEVPAECLSTAEKIAAQFDDDGTCWRKPVAGLRLGELPGVDVAAKRAADSSDPEGIDPHARAEVALVDVLAIQSRERVRNPADPDCVAYEFADGSAIVCATGCWDLRHPKCACGFHFAGERVLPACAVEA